MTAYEMRISDWSSDVCSSDLTLRGNPRRRQWRTRTAIRHDRHAWPGSRATRGSELGRRLGHRWGPRTSLQGRWGEARIRTERQPQNCRPRPRTEEHTSELQSLMRISYAVFCLKKKKTAHK